MDIISYAKSKRYTDESLDGVGALKGAPCEIKSKEAITKDGVNGTRITFSWTGTSGTEYTDSIDVMDGMGIKSMAIEEVSGEQHLIITYDDDTTEDAGKVNSVAFYPEFTAPSAEISGTGDKVLERGSTQNVTITVAFDRGKIDPAYGTSGKRSGAATGYVLNGGTSQGSGTFAVTVNESNNRFRGTVSYAQGEQPKDSNGYDYDSPLPAGSVTTDYLDYEFVNAVWANASDITSMAKQPLVSESDKEIVIDFAAQTVDNPECFDIPSTLTVNGIYVQNPFSEVWEDCADEFTQTTTTHDNAGGASVNYKRYTDNRGYAASGRTIRITWA